jgi:hypothetical protein
MESGSASEAKALWLDLFKKLAVKDQGALACTDEIRMLRDLFGLLDGRAASGGVSQEVRAGILRTLAARLLDSFPTEGAGGAHFQMVDREVAMQAIGDLDGQIIENAISQERARRGALDADAMVDEGDPNTD